MRKDFLKKKQDKREDYGCISRFIRKAVAQKEIGNDKQYHIQNHGQGRHGKRQKMIQNNGKSRNRGYGNLTRHLKEENRSRYNQNPKIHHKRIFNS